MDTVAQLVQHLTGIAEVRIQIRAFLTTVYIALKTASVIHIHVPACGQPQQMTKNIYFMLSDTMTLHSTVYW